MENIDNPKQITRNAQKKTKIVFDIQPFLDFENLAIQDEVNAVYLDIFSKEYQEARENGYQTFMFLQKYLEVEPNEFVFIEKMMKLQDNDFLSAFIKGHYELEAFRLGLKEKSLENRKKSLPQLGAMHGGLLFFLYFLSLEQEILAEHPGDMHEMFFTAMKIAIAIAIAGVLYLDVDILKILRDKSRIEERMKQLKPGYDIIKNIQWEIKMRTARKLTE